MTLIIIDEVIYSIIIYQKIINAQLYSILSSMFNKNDFVWKRYAMCLVILLDIIIIAFKQIIE